MKTSILAAAIVASLSAPLAWADDMPMGGKPMAADKPAPTMDMGRGAAMPAAAAAPATNMGTDKPAAPMQAHMAKMRRQMERIATTTDPKARETLMQEHMQTMQESMKAMRGMGNATTNAGAQAADQKAGMPNGDAQQRLDMMEKRMDMMQEMMEQMMERDKASKSMGRM